jgi:DNA-directed RNA polymerase beta subunit
MEDAMILNKASVERGLAHASVYKSEVSIQLETTSAAIN